MKRYISKEYLQVMLNKWKSQYEGFEGENKNSKLRKKLILKGYNECETIIEQAPTADVVEVVRCKDCKFRKTNDCAMYYECDCGSQFDWENNDDFCSYGQRK